MTEQNTALTSLIIGLYVFLALFHALFGYYFSGQAGFSVGNDDAFISYRYAQNFIEHGVLTFNPDDSTMVEGFSNPAFVALAILVYLGVGPEWLYPALASLGVLSIGVAIALLGRSLWRSNTPVLALPLMLLVATCPPLWIHGTSGLETSWVFLFQVVVWLQCLRIKDSDGAEGLGALLIATGALVVLRTDGFVFPVLAALWLGVVGHRRAALMLILTAAILFAAQVTIRLWYYGLPLPLPFYVKVSGDLLGRIEVSMRFLASIALKNGLFLPLLGVLIAGLTWLSAALRLRSRMALLNIPFELWMTTGIVGYYIYIGGDVYRDRFLIILFPLGALLLLRQMHHWLGRLGLIAGTGALITWQVIAAVAADQRLDYSYGWPKYDRWIVLGTFLGERHPDALLATGAAGKIPFYSGLETIDMWGLNTAEIAFTEAQGVNPGHNTYDTDYVFSQRPDLICTHIINTNSLIFGIDREFYLKEGYRLAYLVRERGISGPPIIEVNPDNQYAVEQAGPGYDYGCILRDGA